MAIIVTPHMYTESPRCLIPYKVYIPKVCIPCIPWLRIARGKQGIKYNLLLSIGSSIFVLDIDLHRHPLGHLAQGHCLLMNHLIHKSVWRKLATMPTLNPIQMHPTRRMYFTVGTRLI